MKINKLIVLLILLSIIGTFMIYSQLPDQVPGHFNFKGEVDRYDSKSSLLFTGALPLILYVMMIVLPKIDPKRHSYAKHEKAYGIIKTIIVVFMILIHWTTILFSLGFNVKVGMIVRIGVGILFIILGNYMGQIRHNYFLGIKNPWTLANETVWRKTHRVGGIAFVASGLLLAFTAFLNGTIAIVVFIASLTIAVVFPTIYSYIEFNKISNKN